MPGRQGSSTLLTTLSSGSRRWSGLRAQPAGDNAILAALGGLSFLAHMLVAGNYGYFRDELYYMADGRHPAFGYVDQPVLIGWIAAVLHIFSADSLIAIHVIPALAAAALAVVTGLMARELRGGRFAQALAALAAAVALVFMATGSIFSMDILDQLWWALGALALMRLIRLDRPRLWLSFGLVAGIGLLTKLDMLFFGLALALALLVSARRRDLRTPWPWLAAAIAFAFLLPYIFWNVANGWPTWEFWHHYGGIGTGPIDFLANQILLMNPLAVPLAVIGIVFYFRQAGAPYRVLGWAFVFLYLLFTLLHLKPYFLAPAYPLLFAPGAVALERFARGPRFWLRPAYAGILALAGLLLAPLAMPILSPATFVATYGSLTGLGNGGAGQSTAGSFPQYLGDRFGWDSMTRTVEAVYAALPPGERAQACVFAGNYGEASALSLLGQAGHLPPVVSGHNNFYLWGPGPCSGTVVIALGDAMANLQGSYARVMQAAINVCAYCMAEENDLPIFVLTGATEPVFKTRWRDVKHFD
jgi:4-amino-4-deoxy-L-arabinose transferase-like glycosyltransferase